MGIESVLLPVVGSSVAKLLLKKYLASSEVAQLFGEELTKIAVAGLKSKLEQREAIRVFERLADKIITQLTPLFEEAGRRGNLNTEAVAQELGATLDGRISPDLLLASDMAPEKLVRALREARPLPPNQLTEAEAELYARALDQTARYLVAAATLLPGFVERLAVTQLQRISRMEDELLRTLASVRMIEEWVSIVSPDKTFARFEADYRQSVSLAVDTLELFGVDIDPQSTRYKLSVAYISLSLLEESSNEEESTLVPAERLLQQLRPGAGRLLIRGDAGSGKSTLFRWMALTVAQGGSKGAERSRSHNLDETDRAMGRLNDTGSSVLVTLWSNRVPFLIRLRDCKDGKLPSIEDFTRQIAPELQAPPAGWMSSILEAGRALVLLDGVDEVPNRNRDDVYKSVERLINKYPGCYFLLSTRPSAVERGWMKPLGFREADISPLSDVDRDQLIGRWHMAVQHELSLRGQQGAELSQLAENLKRGLRENPPIARLATNPLLAAMICALHRDRSQRLPESLADLCEALCHMLLHRRERESNLKLEDFPEEYRTLSYRQKRDIVAELAGHMARNEVSTLDREEAIIKAGEVLDTTPGHQRNEGSVVLNGLIERSGMLREARPGVVDFIHNTFKEYLAGELFGQQRDDEFLAKRALDPAWQNILLFAAATGESTFVRNLLNRILGSQPAQESPAETSRKPRLSADERMRRLMAVRLRSVVQRLDKSLEARIDALRSALFPPATMADAAALADAGDAVVPYLRYQSTYSARSAAACIRALRLINSPAAKACLKDYLAETRQSVLEELGQAVNPLEIKVVQEALLRGEYIRIGRGQVADLSPLAVLTSLQSLDLRHMPVADLSPLA
ncbi:MAG TPA: NACHT domain-containing protein, partial [Myxococcaceae bacterium]